MGRHIKRTQINRTRNYINRRTEYLIKMSKNSTLKQIISKVNPLLWGISKIEYHSLSNNKLKMIITGTKSSGLQFIFNTLKSSTVALSTLNHNFETSNVEIVLQELPYNYLDPSILAKSIANIKNHTRTFGFEKFLNDNISNGLMLQQNFKVLDFKEGYGNYGVINGIRIEIKGITGKMTMSKKVIKTFGALKFNSFDSIIDFGEARNFNKKGIISVKVWISYNSFSS